ncbi:MAG: GGDEF domain-containing protein [Pseudomonadota bacterium]
MARVKRQEGNTGFADFLRLVEEEAVVLGVEFVRVNEENPNFPGALLVFDSALSPAQKKELCRKVGAGNSHQPSIALLDKESGLPGIESFKNQVAVELDRVKKSRIPCALLLIRFDEGKAGGSLKKATPVIKKEIGPDFLPAHYDKSTAALLLPGLNRTKTLEQAGIIHAACVSEISEKVCIGLTVCVAGDVPPVDGFIDRAAKELGRAKQEGWHVFHSFQEQQDDFCQVTAEERAQLFSFIHGGKKE